MSPSDARSFWDFLADDDAYKAVDNRVEHYNPDLDRFWEDGARDLDLLLGALGVELRHDHHVVEIGCGIGRLTRVISERAASVCALDVSQRMLDIARRENGALGNVEWMLGDGTSLAGVEAASADAVVSHVVFQHIPDPAITLGYVREMGRVLRPGGWAAFQISNDPTVHLPHFPIDRLSAAVRGRLRLRPRAHLNPYWLGSHVELPALRTSAAEGSMQVERVVGEGTQYCNVLLRRERAAE